MDGKELRQPAQYADPKLSEGHYATGNRPMDEKEITSKEKLVHWWNKDTTGTECGLINALNITGRINEITCPDCAAKLPAVEDRSGHCLNQHKCRQLAQLRAENEQLLQRAAREQAVKLMAQKEADNLTKLLAYADKDAESLQSALSQAQAKVEELTALLEFH